MKKLVFVFVALFTLVLISGCNAQNADIVRFDENGNAVEVDDHEDGEHDDDHEHEEGDDHDHEDDDKDEISVTQEGESEELPNKLTITSMDAASMSTSLNYNVVEGSVSDDTHSIEINDYRLQKFWPGQKKWSYIASTSYGTMQTGWNDYVVRTYDKDGNQLESLIFSIDYDGVDAPELPGVGANLWITLMLAMSMAFSYLLVGRRRWL